MEVMGVNSSIVINQDTWFSKGYEPHNKHAISVHLTSASQSTTYTIYMG